MSALQNNTTRFDFFLLVYRLTALLYFHIKNLKFQDFNSACKYKTKQPAKMKQREKESKMIFFVG